MTGIPEFDPTQPLSGAEARQRLADARAYLQKEADRGRRQFAANVRSAKERLAFAERELAEIAQKRAKLAPHHAHPGAQALLASLDLLKLVFSSVAMMMGETIRCNEHNLGQLQSERLPEQATFRVPQQEGAFMYARSRLDLALALLGWYQQAEGIDAVLRATVGAQAIRPRTAEEEALRHGRAEALRRAADRDGAGAKLLGRLGSELAEAEALIEWAKTSLARLKEQTPAQQRAALADPDWGKLNGTAVLLATLPDKAEGFPALAVLFPREDAVPLPFDDLAWAKTQAPTRLNIPTPGSLSHG